MWVTSALYLGPFAVAAYARRRHADSNSATVAAGMTEHAEGTAVAVLPGGGASAVAHLIAVPLVVAVGWTIAGLAMWPMILVIAVLASDIGMVGWMLLLHFNDLMPPVTEGSFWFLMHIGVIVGLLTGYPAVSWLLRRNRSVAPA